MPVYSYHTFVLPFIWNMGKKDFESFCKPFCNSPHWRCTDIKTENRLTPNENILSMDDARLIYAEYQYFNPAARRAVYGFESGIVKNFCFNPVNVRNKGKYIIEKDGIKYTLNMNGLRLKIYNTGVALFIFECENPRGEGFEAQNTVAAVKSINEYGRRITLPFLPNETGFILCADKLTVEIDGVGTFVENFKNFSSSISSVEEIYSKVSLTHICDFIKNIIGFGTDIKFSSNPKKILERNTFYIYPAIDDRMFVISLIVDEEGVDRFTKKINDEYPYKYSDEKAKDLYEFIFVDKENSCSCQNKEMRDELIEKHIYKRWLDYGTIYGVAHQSFVATTTDKNTMNSILTIYCELSYLALAQRASLINFQREIAEISNHIEENGKKIKTSTIGDILNLEERFVAFLDQLSLKEVTSQEQGIELYEMLKEFFFIEDERTFLKEQMDSLYSAANTTLDFGLNKGGAVLASIALIMAGVSFIADGVETAKIFFGKTESGELSCFEIVSVFGSFACLGLLIWFIIMMIYRRKK